ncbi:hydroxyethylthiazole kinase [Sediminibacillus halophilus]|uniref:Hydroxyethylthiazole kinase n=1 Tax=Sediminibacillus halophilus TaxID=482461 RepID=A0A1G9WZP0_9BACI|nr:hydroxyethylthiazole kinase [Sediminibacillus halophilus]SDM89939.1 hydroxyethylthiazole kinase [Sediminibacillus halophilus]
MNEIASLLTSVRDRQPLIHNITNQVVTNFTANGLLAMGASPVMANAEEEAADMAAVADALVLNIGTLTTPQVNAMLKAGQAANQKGVPVVFDPVGVGATSFRNMVALRILEEIDVSLIRGNAGEIAFLAGADAEMKGVDSAFQGDGRRIAVEAAKQLETAVVLTGEEDVITDGNSLYLCGNGHQLQTKITGAGCLLSSVTAAFLAVGGDKLSAAAAAVSYYGTAAEFAASASDGPGGFQSAFLDALYQVEEEGWRKKMQLKRVDG